MEPRALGTAPCATARQSVRSVANPDTIPCATGPTTRAEAVNADPSAALQTLRGEHLSRCIGRLAGKVGSGAVCGAVLGQHVS